ncbi:MAG: N-acetylmuramoyl-L-alanine amidase [Chloroflexi bacterium]|nr:N-acetylmuramoyl-L-alanine amidase [Chloroflexota bacterium]
MASLPLASTLGVAFQPPVRAADGGPARLWAAELAFDAADLADVARPSAWPDGRPTWLSPPLAAPRPFRAASPLWLPRDADGAPVEVAVRFSSDGSAWSDWYTSDAEIAAAMTPRDLHAGRLFFTPDGQRARFVQFRIHGQPLRRLVLALHDGEGGPSVATAAEEAEPPLRTLELALPTTPRPPIIARGAWGCPDGDKSPRWPPEYAPPTHIVIHHTVTSNAATDWAQQVRIVWDFHARTLGWGDVGYHYLVDPQGNIYQGRAGGDNVIGGHTFAFNRGTVGLALLGTFVGVQPTPAAREALAQLVAWTCTRRSIEPRVQAAITAERSCGAMAVSKPTVAGHRDFAGHGCSPTDPNGTSCPGDVLYQELGNLRLRASSIMRGLFITEAKLTTTKLAEGQRLDVRVTVWNNTTQVVRGDRNPPPGFAYQEGESFSAKPATGFVRIGLDYAARPAQPQYPYRWGLGGDLQPGERRTIAGAVILRTQRATDYWLTLVQEWVGFAEEFARTRIVYDLTPPKAALDPQPAHAFGPIRISWSGSDAISRVVSYDVQVRDAPSGDWTNWLANTSATIGLYKGKASKTYEFRVRARDEAGNVSEFAAAPAGATRTLVVSEGYRLALPAIRR